MKQSSKRSEWEQRIADCENSGQTIAVWCEANGVKLCNFYYWKRRLRDQTDSSAGQPIKWMSLDIRSLEERPSLPEGTLSVEIGQARIIVTQGFDQHVFRDIVNILQTL